MTPLVHGALQSKNLSFKEVRFGTNMKTNNKNDKEKSLPDIVSLSIPENQKVMPKFSTNNCVEQI